MLCNATTIVIALPTIKERRRATTIAIAIIRNIFREQSRKGSKH
jgi:hypothetical protein